MEGERKKEKFTVVEDIVELSRDLGRMLNNPWMSDVVFVVGEERTRIYAHRMILALRSKPFHVLLYGSMKEGKELEVRIKELEPEVMLALLRYIYTGCVELKPDLVAKLFIATNRYDVQALKVKCGEFLSTHINTNNVCTFLRAADINDEKMLFTKCIKFIEYNTKEVVLTDEFLLLPEELLCKILQSEKLEATELDLFLAVYDWGKHQLTESKMEKKKKKKIPSPGRESALTIRNLEGNSGDITSSSDVGTEKGNTGEVLVGNVGSSAQLESVVNKAPSSQKNSLLSSIDEEKKRKKDVSELKARLAKAISYIRFPQIPPRALMQIVKPTGVASMEELFQAASFIADPSSIDIANRLETKWTPRPGHASRKWRFSTTNCGRNFLFCNSQLTVRKSAASWEWVLGNITFSKGIHIWKVHIDKWCEPMDGGIGVVPPSFETDSSHTHHDFVGYYISDGSLWQNGVRKSSEHSEAAKVGDVIEVALNINQKALTLSKNGVRMYKFNDVSPPLSPAFSLYYPSTQITLLLK